MSTELRISMNVGTEHCAIVGEFVGATQGLGYLIIISSAHLETPTLFSAIIAAAFAGIAMFYVIGFSERRLIFWSSGEAE